jgi:hypothetical protein
MARQQREGTALPQSRTGRFMYWFLLIYIALLLPTVVISAYFVDHDFSDALFVSCLIGDGMLLATVGFVALRRAPHRLRSYSIAAVLLAQVVVYLLYVAVELVYFVRALDDLLKGLWGLLLLVAQLRWPMLDAIAQPRVDGAAKAADSNLHEEQGRESVVRPLNLPDELRDVGERIAQRAELARGIAKFALGAMMAIVLLGLGLSLGLWAFSAIDRTKGLAMAAGDLRRAVSETSRLRAVLDKIGPLGVGQTDAALMVDGVRKSLEAIGQSIPTDPVVEAAAKSYVDAQSRTNWGDVAIRITVAVLSLFLVQVFFSVYKYAMIAAMRLSERLDGIIALSRDKSPEAKAKLLHLLASADGGSFGREPTLPIKDILPLLKGRE